MKTVGGRMRVIQPQFDAVFRAGYRMQEVGRDMMQVGERIIGTIAGMTQEFGEFEFMVNRATGAMGLHQDALENGENIYERFKTRILETSRELRLFKPAEVAKGVYFWASATGQQVESMGDLEAVLRRVAPLMKIAAMTQTDYETAIKGVYSILIQYGMRLGDTQMVTEKLHQVTQRTAAEFPDLVNSFKMVGPVAAANNVTFNEVANVLGRLADAGIRGSMAGRGLRQFFIQTVRPSAIAKAALDDLWESTPAFMGKTFEEMVFPGGTFGGIDKYVNLLAQALRNATDAHRNFYLARITTANELPILTALVTKEIDVLNGVSAGWDKTKEASQDAAAGFALAWGQLAESWLGTIGAVERGIESLRIMIGGRIAKILTPVMETFADALERMISWVGDPRNQDIIDFFAGAAAAIGAFLATGGGLMLFVGSLTNLGAAIMVVAKVFGPLVVKAIGFAGAVGALGAAIVQNAEYIIDSGRKIYTNISEAFGGGENAANGLKDALNSLGAIIVPVFSAIIKRTADLAVILSELFKILMGFAPTATILQGVLAVVGALFGAKLIMGVLRFGAALLGISKIVPALKPLAPLIFAMNTALASSSTVAGKAAASVGVLRTAIRGLISSTGIGLIAVGFITAYEAVPPFRDAVDGTLDMIIDKSGEAKARMQELVDSFDQGKEIALRINTSKLGQELNKAVDDARAVYEQKMKPMNAPWDLLGSQQAWEAASRKRDDTITKYIEQGQAIIDKYADSGAVSSDRFWNKVLSISDRVGTSIPQSIQMADNYFGGIVKGIKDADAEARKAMDNFQKGLGQGMVPGRGLVAGKSYGPYIIAQLMRDMDKYSPKMQQEIKDFIADNGGEGIIQGVESIGENGELEEPVRTMWKDVANTIVSAAQGVKDLNKRIEQALEDAISPEKVGRTLRQNINKWVKQGFKDEKGNFVPEAAAMLAGELQSVTDSLQTLSLTMKPADFTKFVQGQIDKYVEVGRKNWKNMPPMLQQTLEESVREMYKQLGIDIPPSVLAKLHGEGKKGGASAGKGTKEGVKNETGGVTKAVANMYSTAERSMKFGKKPYEEGKSVPSKTARGMNDNKRPLSTAVSSIVRKITGINLSGSSYTWGAHLLRNLAAGIRNNIILVQKAARRAAGVIAGPLEHSVPKYGPLADDDVWGEHFINNIANAMDKRLPALRAKAMEVAEAMKVEQQAAFNNGVTFETSARKTIKVQVEVTSPDGSVDRVKASQLENALITNDLILAIEHMSTVG
jgi:TP901 family phage tail tape measure protein